MKAGFIGLGKLGFPCALVAATAHDVVGYDVSPRAAETWRSRKYPHKEVDAQAYLEKTTLQIVPSIDDVVAHADILFVAVQTPHGPEFEGTTRLPEERADFDYTFLKQAVSEVNDAALRQQKNVTLVVISTVLPGTSVREILPLLTTNGFVRYVYNPFFIAMGTTIPDYKKPEFILVGSDDADAVAHVREFYSKCVDGRIVHMGVTSAEMTKCLYNTFIGQKITLANTAMQLAEVLGANCDDVMGALCQASDRLISKKYLQSGMGDSGGCHPRDNIALSWLVRTLGFSYDPFGHMMTVREEQTDWLAQLIVGHARLRDLPIVILGMAYKPETNLTLGSCSTLLENILKEDPRQRVSTYDPEVTGEDTAMPWNAQPSVFVLATPHKRFETLELPQGSVLVDPWGKSPDRTGVELHLVGRR